MIKILFRYIIIISFIFSFINTAYAFNLNKVYSLNTVSAAKIEINDTNLVDEKNAEKLVSINNDFKKSLEEESKVIQEKNKNRKIALENFSKNQDMIKAKYDILVKKISYNAK